MVVVVGAALEARGVAKVEEVREVGKIIQINTKIQVAILYKKIQLIEAAIISSIISHYSVLIL